MTTMNICPYCLKDNGHTEYCNDLQKKAYDSNVSAAIRYACNRAVISGYKELYGEKDKNLIPMWEKSLIFWCDSIEGIILRAANLNTIKDIYMPEA